MAELRIVAGETVPAGATVVRTGKVNQSGTVSDFVVVEVPDPPAPKRTPKPAKTTKRK